MRDVNAARFELQEGDFFLVVSKREYVREPAGTPKGGEFAKSAEPPSAGAEWTRLNKAFADATDAYITEKKRHEDVTATVRQRYDPHDEKFFDDPEYQASLLKRAEAEHAMLKAEAEMKEQAPKMRVEAVTALATQVANEMGMNPENIHVGDYEPPPFKVGDREFREGAHYDSATGDIEVNAHSYQGEPSVDPFKGMIAHELSHQMYDVLQSMVDREERNFKAKALAPDGKGYTDWYYQRFEDDIVGHKHMKPEARAELEKEFPAATVMAKLAVDGDTPPELFTGISPQMIKEDGHSEYAKAYWTPEAIKAKGSYRSAITETLAEITRFLKVPESFFEEGDPSPTSPWVVATKAMHQWYADRMVRIRAMVAKIRAERPI